MKESFANANAYPKSKLTLPSLASYLYEINLILKTPSWLKLDVRNKRPVKRVR